jgi:hypothetical protein
MSQAQAATGVDRLPWLPDEPKLQPQTRRRGTNNRELVSWAFVAMLLVAIVSYWMGARSWQPAQSPQPRAHGPSTTAPVPHPSIAKPQQPQVLLEPAPQVSPAPAREVPLARPRAVKRSVIRPSRFPRRENETAALEKAVADQNVTTEPAKTAAPPKTAPSAKTVARANPDAKPLKAWPASQSQGAKGRIVRIGAFGSRQQAKVGWRHMVRAYPAVAHLKATVVTDRNSRGRRFYRFQIGTTSQAHSEVLCQRMDKIRLSCAVVGLAQDPTGVER